MERIANDQTVYIIIISVGNSKGRQRGGGGLRIGETTGIQQIFTEKYGGLIRTTDKTGRGLPTLGRGGEWLCAKTQRDFELLKWTLYGFFPEGSKRGEKLLGMKPKLSKRRY